MRIPRFFQELNVELNQDQVLSSVNHRHAIQVLRLKVGGQLILFDGSGGEYLAKIKEIKKRESSAELETFNDVSRESCLRSTLVLSVIKPDKMDFAIQKAVELGITSIQPMITSRSVMKIKADRLQKKIQHWQAIIIGACEQSGRTQIPNIEGPLSLTDCLNKYKNDLCVGMHPASIEKLSDLVLDKEEKNVSLFVGPEGGFSDEEEALIQSHEIKLVNFGKRVLRAETAVIVGLMACQERWGDL